MASDSSAAGRQPRHRISRTAGAPAGRLADLRLPLAVAGRAARLRLRRRQRAREPGCDQPSGRIRTGPDRRGGRGGRERPGAQRYTGQRRNGQRRNGSASAPRAAADPGRSPGRSSASTPATMAATGTIRLHQRLIWNGGSGRPATHRHGD